MDAPSKKNLISTTQLTFSLGVYYLALVASHMRLKLAKLLTVCLITLAVLSPELLVLGVVWKYHLQLESTKSLASEMNKLDSSNYIHTLLTCLQDEKFIYLLCWFLLSLSIFVGLGFFLYDRYLVYRASVLQKQVQMLEKLWQQSIEK